MLSACHMPKPKLKFDCSRLRLLLDSLFISNFSAANSIYFGHVTLVAGGLEAAHSGHMPFQRDGCYFLHKHSNYDTDGLTPLALLWKDASCSRYFIDTDAEGVVPQHQAVILRYLEEGTLGTADEPPTSLGRMPASMATASSATLRSASLQVYKVK